MIYDISVPLSPELAVWPEDVPLQRQVLCSLAEGATSTSSAFRSTAHLGTHGDAPGHTTAGGDMIDACPLDAYWGRCQVLRVDAQPGQAIEPADLPEPIRAERVLLATGTYPDRGTFREDFAGCSVALIDALADAGVRLLGIDTPSIDVFVAAAMPAHLRCGARGLLTLEGLVLDQVPAGEYELVALPLRLVGFDGSPVRAALRTLV